MKAIDFLCASPASTAVCVSTDHHSMVRHGGRKLDRHNPHLRDNGRRSKATVPSSSQLPHTKPNKHHHHHHQKSRKSSSSSNKPPQDRLISTSSPPGGSSRYLLSDSAFFDVLSEFEPMSALVPAEPTYVLDDIGSLALNNPSSASTTPSDQVVVLRVSLHCKGCEGKLRKHISRMKGVTSFTIDFAAKKVTVVGDVTPLGVLASVSRVKRAQLWQAQSSLPISSTL